MNRFTSLIVLTCLFYSVFAQIPANDSCNSAFVLTPNVTPQYDTFRLSGATSDLTGCRRNEDVWFKFEMPSSGGVRITTQRVQLNHDVSIRLFTGSCGSMSAYACEGTCNYYSADNCGTGIYLKDTSLFGDTLYIRATKYYNFTTGDTAAICIEHILDSEIPSNDSCGAASVLTPNLSIDMDTFSFKNSLVELSGDYCRDNEDVWFKFEVPSSGAFKIHQNRYKQSSSISMRVYTGGCTLLNTYACEGTCNYYSTGNCGDYLYVNDPSLAGDTVWLRGAPYYNFDNRDSFAIGVEEVPSSDLLPNDTCESAIDISYTISAGMDTFSNNNAIANTAGPYCRDNEGMWFKFEVPANGAFEILQDRYKVDTRLGISMYDSGCAVLSQYSCANGNCSYLSPTNCGQYLRVIDTALAGDTMLLRVSPFYNFDNRDSFKLRIKEIPSVAIPANDKCADAIVLPTNSTLQLDTFDLTNALPEITNSCRDDEDVWFKFVAPSNGAFVVEGYRVTMNHEPAFQLLMGSCGSLVPYECDSNCNYFSADNACGDRFFIRDSTLGGDTLYIRASRFYSFSLYGTFSIGVRTISDADLPDNDDCINAQALNVTTGNCIVDTFTNANTTYSSVPTGSCGSYSGADVWFKFEMPSSDDVFIDLSQVGANTSSFRITAFSGGCNNMVEEACNSSGSYPNLGLRNLGLAGDTILVHVYKTNNNTVGDSFGICLKDTVMPPLRTTVGQYEKTSSCDILSGNGWFDLIDSTGNLVASIDPNGANLGRTCFGIEIQDSSAAVREATDTLGNTVYLGPRTWYVSPSRSNSVASVRLYYHERELKIWRDSLLSKGLGVGPSLESFYQDSLRISKTEGADLNNPIGGNPIQINPTVTKVRDSVIMAEFTVTSFSNFVTVFNPGNPPVPVPVNWLSFQGRRVNDIVYLKWATATELNCSHYEVQRSSDGRTYETIGIVEGHGTSNEVSQYRYQEHNATARELYYRLKQIDYNGSYGYSNDVVVGPQNIVEVVPNPFGDRIRVSIAFDKIREIELVDMYGRVVYTEKVNDKSVDLIFNDAIEPGVYSLRIITKREVLEKKVIKK